MRLRWYHAALASLSLAFLVVSGVFAYLFRPLQSTSVPGMTDSAPLGGEDTGAQPATTEATDTGQPATTDETGLGGETPATTGTAGEAPAGATTTTPAELPPVSAPAAAEGSNTGGAQPVSPTGGALGPGSSVPSPTFE